MVQDARQIDTGGNPIGTQAAADYVAQQKLQGATAPPATAAPAPPPGKPWSNRGEMRRVFANLREIVGEVSYLGEMTLAKVKDPSEFRNGADAEACYVRLLAIADKEAA